MCLPWIREFQIHIQNEAGRPDNFQEILQPDNFQDALQLSHSKILMNVLKNCKRNLG